MPNAAQTIALHNPEDVKRLVGRLMSRNGWCIVHERENLSDLVLVTLSDKWDFELDWRLFMGLDYRLATMPRGFEIY